MKEKRKVGCEGGRVGRRDKEENERKEKRKKEEENERVGKMRGNSSHKA